MDGVGGHAACEAPQVAEGGDDGEGGAVAGPGEFGGANGDVGYAFEGGSASRRRCCRGWCGTERNESGTVST